jgi:hypothetical protein
MSPEGTLELRLACPLPRWRTGSDRTTTERVHALLNGRARHCFQCPHGRKGLAVRLASHCRPNFSLIFRALFAVQLAACATEPQPWSPEVDKVYHEIYHPIIDGG